MRSRLVAMPLAMCSFAAACTIVDGLTVPKDTGASALDAGGDVDRCNHAEPPGRPDPSSPNGAEITFAVVGKRFDFAPKDGAGADIPIGFDIDRTCTCPDVESCIPAKAREAVCDSDDRGRDDQLRPMLEFAKSPPYGFDISELATHAASRGIAGVLLQVASYNGLADDPDVTVGVLRSPGLRDVVDGGAGPNRLPTFTIADRWSTVVEQATLIGDDVVPLRSVAAYVRDFTLVVKTDFILQIAREGIPVHLTEAIIAAHIVKLGDGSYSIDRGTIAARALVPDVIRALGALDQPPGSGNYLCTTAALEPVYGAIKKKACEAADLAGSGALDRTGAPCTAVSVAFVFEGAPASLGPPLSVRTANVCADASIECPPL